MKQFLSVPQLIVLDLFIHQQVHSRQFSANISGIDSDLSILTEGHSADSLDRSLLHDKYFIRVLSNISKIRACMQSLSMWQHLTAPPDPGFRHTGFFRGMLFKLETHVFILFHIPYIVKFHLAVIKTQEHKIQEPKETIQTCIMSMASSFSYTKHVHCEREQQLLPKSTIIKNDRDRASLMSKSISVIVRRNTLEPIWYYH